MGKSKSQSTSVEKEARQGLPLSGLFAGIPVGDDRLPIASEKFQNLFPGAYSNCSTAVVYSSGSHWRVYENERFYFFIDGEILFRGEPPVDASQHNKKFVREFDLSLLKRVKGNFNAVIVGKEENASYLITGGLGLKPLFIYRKDGVLYAGDDLRFFKHCFPQLDFNELALMQLALFNFPLGKTSFLKEVDLIPPGSWCDTRKPGELNQWYDAEASISQPRLSSRESLDFLHGKLNAIVEQYLPPDTPVGLSLTGGFDGRTILSAIEDRSQLRLYTFGSRTSGDIRVAKEISREFELDHTAYYIDEDYYQKYFLEEADEFIMRSNGVGTYERTHYLHAFKHMADRVAFILSGNAGSEIFRTILHGGILIPQLVFDLLQSDKPADTIRKAIEHNTVLQALEIDAYQYVDDLVETWHQLMHPFERETGSYRGVYRFFLRETLRKWFGTEMRIEDKYCPNRAPFIDEEFLEAIHQTPFSVAYQPFLSQSPVQRKMGQKTYSYIQVKNDKKLARMKTSRGYSPYDVISIWGVPRVAYSFFTKKIRRKKENDYNQFETAKYFFDHHIPQLNSSVPWLNREKLIQFYSESETWKAEIRDYSRMLCLGIWYDSIW